MTDGGSNRNFGYVVAYERLWLREVQCSLNIVIVIVIVIVIAIVIVNNSEYCILSYDNFVFPQLTGNYLRGPTSAHVLPRVLGAPRQGQGRARIQDHSMAGTLAMACTMILCRVFFGLALYTETFHSGPTLACVAKGVVLDKCIETGLAQIPRRSLEGKIVRVLGHHLKRSIATHCHVRYTEATVIGLIFPSVQLLVTMESKPEFEPVPIRYHNMEGATVPTLVHLARPLHAS